jgi:DNA-binding SARP family transcriptional activator/TolB-like protein
MILRLLTLGGLRAFADGAELHSLASSPVRASLLIYLAVERSATRDQLQALLWPDSSAEAAARSLRQALYGLRRDFGRDILEARGIQVNALPSLQCDVIEFQDALQAHDTATVIDRYRGAFLADHHLATAPQFTTWADGRRAASERAFKRYCRARLEELEAAADLAGALEVAHAWAAIDPMDDEAQHRVVLLLAALGQRSAALRQYEAYERLLAGEGLRPLDATTSLIAQIRRSGNGGNGDASHARLPVELPAISAPAVASPDTAPPPALRPHRMAWIALAVGALLLVVATALLRRDAQEHEYRRIAVLPFVNRTGDPAHDQTARRISEHIDQTIARTGVVEVVDFEAAPRAAGGASRVSQHDDLARSLGASTLVQGTLSSDATLLVASARLVDASTGEVIHEVEPVRGQGADVTRLMDGVAQRVAGAVAAFKQRRFTAWRPRLSTPPRYDALVHFLAGLDAAASYHTDDARNEFLAAAALDSTFTQAWLFAANYTDDRTAADSMLRRAAQQRDRLTEFDRLSVDRERHRQRAAFGEMYLVSRRLAELAPSSVDAALWLAAAALTTNRFAEASRILHALPAERGWLRDSPLLTSLDLDAHHYAGDFETEVREMRSAAHFGAGAYERCYSVYRGLVGLGRESSVDSLVATCLELPDAPEAGSAWLNVGLEYRAHGHTAAARRALLRAREWYAAQSQRYHNTRVLAQIEWNLGNWQATIDEQRAVMQRVTPNARDYARLGAAAARLGDTATAHEMSRNVAKLGSFPIDQAIIAAALGNRQAAMEHLRNAVWSGAIPAVQFHRQPGLDPLRGYSEFDAMLRPR